MDRRRERHENETKPRPRTTAVEGGRPSWAVEKVAISGNRVPLLRRSSVFVGKNNPYCFCEAVAQVFNGLPGSRSEGAGGRITRRYGPAQI